MRKLRPWLQDFTLPGMVEFGPAELRAQAAAQASGASSWTVCDSAK